jgi:hypothetical protein
MQSQQKVLNDTPKEAGMKGKRQKAKYRPDEETFDRANWPARHRGARIKLSARGDHRQHKRGARRA